MRDKLPTTNEMLDHLDIHVQGQDQAKRDLVKSVYFHYLNLVATQSEGVRPPVERCLLMGPTGSGKTLLVQTLGRFLDVPVVYCNTPSLTSEGYVGESVSDLLARFESYCDGDSFLKSRGIICLDEFDKIYASSGPSGRGGDIGGLAVQQELLALLDGQILSRTKDSSRTPQFSVDTSKVLVIATGAFVGIDKIVRSRTSSFGFRSHQQSSPSNTNTTEVEPEDIEKFGFIPELVARFSSIVQLSELTEGELLHILANPTQAPITPYRTIFEMHGIGLSFEDSALALMAEQARSSGMGARSLRRLVSNSLKDACWRLDELRNQGVCEIRVGEATVAVGASPEAVHGTSPLKYSADELRATVFTNQLMQRLLHQEDAALGTTKSFQTDVSTADDSSVLKELTNTTDWTNEQVLEQYSLVKELTGSKDMPESAATWWASLETTLAHRPALLLRIVEELALRKSTLTEFYRASIYSNTDNLQANLEYLDYVRELEAWDHRPSRALSVIPAAAYSLSVTQVRRLLRFDESSLAARLHWEFIEEAYARIGMDWPRVLGTMSDAAVANLDDFLDLAVRGRTWYLSALVPYRRYLGLYAEHLRNEGELGPHNPQWRQEGQGFPRTSRWSFAYRIYRLVAEDAFFNLLGERYPTVAVRNRGPLSEILEYIQAQIAHLIRVAEQDTGVSAEPQWLLGCFHEMSRNQYAGEIYRDRHAGGIITAFRGPLSKSLPSWTPDTVVKWAEYLVSSLRYQGINILEALQLLMKSTVDDIAPYWGRSVPALEKLVPGTKRAWNTVLGGFNDLK